MTRHTRRQFFQWTGASAAALALVQVAPAADSKPSPDKKKVPFELGLASYTTRKFSLDETLEMAQKAGLKHICLKDFHLAMDSSPEAIRQAAEKVKAAGIDLYGGGVITMKTPEQVNRAFEYAKTAGMRVIVGVPHPDVLPLVEEKVKQYDIKVAIHNHGPGDKLYPTPQSAYEKIKDLDKRIGLCMDVGHCVRIGADPVADAERYADRLHDIHLKDVSEASPKGQCVEAGRGVIDLPALLQTLVKTNYQGIASFEYEKDPDNPLPGLIESVEYVRKVLAGM